MIDMYKRYFLMFDTENRRKTKVLRPQTLGRMLSPVWVIDSCLGIFKLDFHSQGFCLSPAKFSSPKIRKSIGSENFCI